jgi:hypothetical protein
MKIGITYNQIIYRGTLINFLAEHLSQPYIDFNIPSLLGAPQWGDSLYER